MRLAAGLVVVAAALAVAPRADAQLAPWVSFGEPVNVHERAPQSPWSTVMLDPTGGVPLIVEAVAEPAQIALVPLEVPLRPTGAHYLCQTPCVLYAEPGRYRLVTFDATRTRWFDRINLGPGGHHVRVRAAVGQTLSASVLVGGLGLIIVGATTIALACSTCADPTTGIGGGLIAGGIVGFIVGVVLIAVGRGGVYESQPLGAAPFAR